MILWHSCVPWAATGYGTQTAIWTRALRDAGHEVAISAWWGLNGSPTVWEQIPVLPGFGGGYCSPSLLEHARHIRPDLVITLGDVRMFDPAVIRQLPAAHWLPCDCRPMSAADRAVAETGGGRLIAMSRFGLARFRDAGFTTALYWPHGVDMTVFTPPQDRDALRARHGISPGTFVIGVNAANNDLLRKAPGEMMLAFARFTRAHPDSLMLLHTGIRCDGGPDLAALTENLGITDRVRAADQYRYSCGMIPAQDMAAWYGCLDVLCAATYGEGFGVPVVEALSCGVPVITTACSALEELNPDGVTVGGEPFWNGVHQAWWIRPSPGLLYRAMEEAYDRRGDVVPAALRASAGRYDIPVVAREWMTPVITTLGGG